MAPNDIFGKPFKLKFVRPAEMLLFSSAVCDPPLGQTTVVPSGQQIAQFTLLIESSKSFSEQSWEAILWHDAANAEAWSELAFHEVSTDSEPLAVSSSSRAQVYRRYFAAALPRPAQKDRVRFTFKFRVVVGSEWRWANESLKTSDGELYFQSGVVPSRLDDYLKGASIDLQVKPLHSESPGAHLWSLVAPIEGARGSDSSYTKTCLGIPRSYSRWFACVRTWSPWLAPRHGRAPFSPQQGALLCSFLRWDGVHFVIIAISGVKDLLTVMDSDEHGNVIATSRNDREGQGEVQLLAAAAKTFDIASAAVMYRARHVVAGENYLDRAKKMEMERMVSDDVKAEWMENWYDGLTYCTWNGLGQDLTEGKIFNALAELKKHNINVTNLIIDDNWQSLGNTGTGQSQFDLGWSDFEANTKGFPQGLKHTTTIVREKYPNIQHISVWHAILGYWGALDPHGKIAKAYKTKSVNRDGNRKMTVIDAEDVDRMYDDFYKFLSSSGIDSVKTDAQFMLDEIVDAPDRRDLITATQDAWTIAALRHFSIKAISCMSQFPQNLFHTQMPTNKPCFMVRNSDDFFPDIPSSHPYHLFTNAHNTLFTSYLNIIPDWDMFQTYHDYSHYHAAGRCVSGGPVYITDEPGKHNMDLIAQMTAQDVQGKTIILRPSLIGKSINVYTAYEEEQLLKVGTFCGGKGGTSMLALFNVSNRTLLELVQLSCFLGIEAEEEYVIRGHNTGQISPVMTLSSVLPFLSVEIDVKGCDIFSAFPVRSFNLEGKSKLSTKATVLGLLGKMTGAAAVLGSDMEIDEHGRLSISISLKALGVLGIYISNITNLSVDDNFLVLMKKNAVPKQYVKLGKLGNVLEIDTENAWGEMKLEPGYSNEIVVDVIISM